MSKGKLVTVLLFGVSLIAWPTAHAGGLAGAFVGNGHSYQYIGQACVADGPTVTELRQLASDAWAFDTAFTVEPLGCEGSGVGVGSFTSQNGKALYGTPETGLAGSGSYDAFYPAGYSIHVDWDIHVSPVGPRTTWSLHQHVDDPQFGPYEAWWNATMPFVGAHA